MKQDSQPTQLDHLKNILLPILAEASVGHFDLNVPINPKNDRDLNELLAGVQILLDVIRQQQEEISATKKLAFETQRRATNILATVLDTTIK